MEDLLLKRGSLLHRLTYPQPSDNLNQIRGEIQSIDTILEIPSEYEDDIEITINKKEEWEKDDKTIPENKENKESK